MIDRRNSWIKNNEFFPPPFLAVIAVDGGGGSVDGGILVQYDGNIS